MPSVETVIALLGISPNGKLVQPILQYGCVPYSLVFEMRESCCSYKAAKQYVGRRNSLVLASHAFRSVLKPLADQRWTKSVDELIEESLGYPLTQEALTSILDIHAELLAGKPAKMAMEEGNATAPTLDNVILWFGLHNEAAAFKEESKPIGMSRRYAAGEVRACPSYRLVLAEQEEALFHTTCRRNAQQLLCHD